MSERIETVPIDTSLVFLEPEESREGVSRLSIRHMI